VTRTFASTVLRFYTEHAARVAKDGAAGAPSDKSGAVVVVQRTNSDLKLPPQTLATGRDSSQAESLRIISCKLCGKPIASTKVNRE
jgi:hypothetical protein